MSIERQPSRFPRATPQARSIPLDTLVICRGDDSSFDEMFQALPTCLRVELSSFQAGEGAGYFEDVALFFASAPDEPFSITEFVKGSPTREAVEAALEVFDARFEF